MNKKYKFKKHQIVCVISLFQTCAMVYLIFKIFSHNSKYLNFNNDVGNIVIFIDITQARYQIIKKMWIEKWVGV